jgi:hypothetical protein
MKQPPISRKLARLLNNLIEFEILDSWSGKEYEEDAQDVSDCLIEARAKLRKYLAEIESVYTETMRKRFSV